MHHKVKVTSVAALFAEASEEQGEAHWKRQFQYVGTDTTVNSIGEDGRKVYLKLDVLTNRRFEVRVRVADDQPKTEHNA